MAMDMFLGAVIVALVGLAIAPFFLMAGSFGKKKQRPGKADGSDGSATLPLMFGGDGGGKGKSHGHDTDGGGSDSDGSGGGGDGGGGGGE